MDRGALTLASVGATSAGYTLPMSTSAGHTADPVLALRIKVETRIAKLMDE